MITHCIFDMDGLLLDTERIYSQVTEEIVKPFGKTYTWELKSKMMGKRSKEASELLVNALELPITAQEYLDRRNEMQGKLFPSAKPLPGVEKLVFHLKSHGIPIAVATSSNKDAFDLKTMNNQHLFSQFDVIVTGDDDAVKNGKPSPDIFIEAAKRLKTEAGEHCLVFEDAPNGVLAALSARMKCVWVPDPNVDKSSLEAHQVLDSLEQFEPVHWGLPQFK